MLPHRQPGLERPAGHPRRDDRPRLAPGLFLNLDTAAGALNLWKLHVDFTTPANSMLSGPTSIPVDAFSPTCGTGAACVPQPTPGNALTPVAIG